MYFSTNAVLRKYNIEVKSEATTLKQSTIYNFELNIFDTKTIHFVANGSSMWSELNRGRIFGKIIAIKKYTIRNEEASTPAGYAKAPAKDLFIVILVF
jgi:hypothetical protein